MRVLVRQIDRSHVGEIEADPDQQPARTRTLHSNQEVFLDWERAFDDSGHLRRCIICGSDQLFQHKTFPQITPFVIVLAFALSLIGVLGYVTDIAILIGMTCVLFLDIMILFFAKTRLICYRCRSQYRNVDIADYHRRWDRATEARLRNQQDRRPAESPKRIRSREDFRS